MTNHIDTASRIITEARGKNGLNIEVVRKYLQNPRRSDFAYAAANHAWENFLKGELCATCDTRLTWDNINAVIVAAARDNPTVCLATGVCQACGYNRTNEDLADGYRDALFHRVSADNIRIIWRKAIDLRVASPFSTLVADLYADNAGQCLLCHALIERWGAIVVACSDVVIDDNVPAAYIDAGVCAGCTAEHTHEEITGAMRRAMAAGELRGRKRIVSHWGG